MFERLNLFRPLLELFCGAGMLLRRLVGLPEMDMHRFINRISDTTLVDSKTHTTASTHSYARLYVSHHSLCVSLATEPFALHVVMTKKHGELLLHIYRGRIKRIRKLCKYTG